MKLVQWKLGFGVVAVALMTVTVFGVVTPAGRAQSASDPVRFGMDINSMDAQQEAGVAADYATIWAGVWNLKHGWGGPNAAIDRAVAKGVTPVVHFYYWGDDISKSCVENGCYSTLHSAQKDKAGWQRLAEQLATNLNAHRDGKPVVIIIESEFNKGDIQTYEAFDTYLVEKEKFFREKIPGVQLVLGFGSWNTDAWKTFDRAAAGADFVGVQAMRGSTKNNLASYVSVLNATLSAMKKAQSLFSKPIMLTDLALSSYPNDPYEKHQAETLATFFSRMPELKAAGMRALIYRSWSDTPSMSTANYYGEAERHWGLVRTTEPYAKLAKAVWVRGVSAERQAFQATFKVSPNVSEWWVEAIVSSDQPIRSVDVRVDGGAWTALPKTSWGHWAKSLHVVRGSSVEFQATNEAGLKDKSDPVCWMCSTPATSSPKPTTSSPAPTTSAAKPTTSSAAPTTSSTRPADIRIEGENFVTKPTGSRVNDASAWGGAYWNQSVNGGIEHRFQSDAGEFELRIRAKGTRLGGIDPQMNVYVDGALVAQWRPPTTWTENRFPDPIRLTAGEHVVKVTYTNDYANASGDRNLHVDRVAFMGLG